jgi:hypothetical protein
MMENLARSGLQGDSIIHDYENNLEFYLHKCL